MFRIKELRNRKIFNEGRYGGRRIAALTGWTTEYVGAAIGRQQMRQRVKEDSGRRVAAPTRLIGGAVRVADSSTRCASLRMTRKGGRY